MSLTARVLAVPGAARSALTSSAVRCPSCGRGRVLLPDREDLGDLVEILGLLHGGVAAERLDHRETLVTGRCPAVALRFQPVQEPQDPGPVDVSQTEFLGRYPLRCP